MDPVTETVWKVNFKCYFRMVLGQYLRYCSSEHPQDFRLEFYCSEFETGTIKLSEHTKYATLERDVSFYSDTFIFCCGKL